MRGEVWRADLSPTRGTEQSGVRPVLVVQTDRANPFSPHTIIVPSHESHRGQIWFPTPHQCSSFVFRLS